jgi:uncharacterized paraquat-inducible protein A
MDIYEINKLQSILQDCDRIEQQLTDLTTNTMEEEAMEIDQGWRKNSNYCASEGDSNKRKACYDLTESTDEDEEEDSFVQTATCPNCHCKLEVEFRIDLT